MRVGRRSCVCSQRFVRFLTGRTQIGLLNLMHLQTTAMCGPITSLLSTPCAKTSSGLVIIFSSCQTQILGEAKSRQSNRLFCLSGIDLSECLQYPDFSVVVLYKKVVIGFGFMVPDVKYNEAYISFLLVHPEWRRAGIATFMIYHLIQVSQI